MTYIFSGMVFTLAKFHSNQRANEDCRGRPCGIGSLNTETLVTTYGGPNGTPELVMSLEVIRDAFPTTRILFSKSPS